MTMSGGQVGGEATQHVNAGFALTLLVVAIKLAGHEYVDLHICVTQKALPGSLGASRQCPP